MHRAFQIGRIEKSESESGLTNINNVSSNYNHVHMTIAVTILLLDVSELIVC